MKGWRRVEAAEQREMVSTERGRGDEERSRRELRELTDLLVGRREISPRDPTAEGRTWLLSTTRDEVGSLLAGQLLARISTRVRLVRPEDVRGLHGTDAADGDTLLWLRPGSATELRAASLAADGAVVLLPGGSAREASLPLEILRQSLPASRLIPLSIEGAGPGRDAERRPILSWAPGSELPAGLLDRLGALPPRGIPFCWAFEQLKGILS